MQIDGQRERNPISRLTLQITDACNLQCVYCFTGNKECADTFVSEEDFGYFLAFCLRNGMRGIRLTGGETMLHPHVHRFVRLAVRAGLPVHVFSNFAIKECIEAFDVPGRDLSFLVNVNDREKYDDSAWDNLNRNLERAEQRGYQIVLGYTVHTAPFNIPHIVTLASVYNISKIRVSPAKPTIGAANKSLDLAEMKDFAESVVRLSRELDSTGRQLVLDCPIPFCHIPQEYLPFFTQELKLTGTCDFGTSVNVNFEVGHCYVTNSLLAKRNLRTFKDVADMMEYMRGQVKTLDRLCPSLSTCSDCLYGKQGVCAGGCYGFLHKVACGEDI